MWVGVSACVFVSDRDDDMSAPSDGAGEAVGVPEACPGGTGLELARKAAVCFEPQAIAACHRLHMAR